MGREATASLNQQLTTFAQGHMNDLRRTMELAERLAPTVTVGGSTGQYKKFDDLNSFQTYATARALGGEAKRIEFAATDAFYNCKPQALEVTVDKEERNMAGPDNAVAQQLLDEGKIRALLNVTALSHVRNVCDIVLAALTAEAGPIGVWSDPDIDPVDQLDKIIDDLATACGSTEGIKVTMSLTAWRTLRNHAKVKARTTGVQVGGITLEQLNGILAIPVDVAAYAITYNAAALGQTKSKARLLAGEVLITYSLPSPTQYDPSAFKNFTVGPGGVQSVRSWMAPSGFYDAHVIDWSEHIAQTSTIAAKRITLS